MDPENFNMEAAQEELSNDLFGDEGASENPLNEEEITLDEGTDNGEVDPASSADPEKKPDTKEQKVETGGSEAKPAPKTWRAEAAAKWAEVPAEVQAEILKREEDIFKGIESYKEAAQFGATVDKIMTPYKDFLAAEGYDALQQIDGLMKAQYVLAKGTPEQKTAIFNHLIQAYNIPVQGGQPEDDYIDPQVKVLREELNSVKSTLTAREQREAALTRQKIQSEVDAFASLPENIYFDEVATDVAVLLRGGGATSLKEAYEKAVWANPVTRAKEQERQAKAAAEKAKAESAAKLASARRATSANISTRARSGSVTAPVTSIDDTLEQTLREIQSRTK